MKANRTVIHFCSGLVVTGLMALAVAARGDDPPPPPKSAPRATTTASPAPKAMFRNVGVAEFAKLRAGGTNVVLDVRTAAEFKAGHLAGAVNLNVNEPEFKEKVKALDKGKLYLVHCAVGGRSAKACRIMGAIGFTNLVNLEGGFKAWEKEGQPVER